MAHPVEPMDIDSDFDNKENSFHHSNVQPCTEKGYEELDVSDLNMKLRYSVTPASSPMSRSYTANCVDNKTLESGDDSLNVTVNENTNLTRSLNSSLKNDNVIKSLKALPLQSISTEQFNDSNRSTSVLRPLDTTTTPDNANVTVTAIGPNDIDENLSLPSSSSSAVHTPEATTPTKEIPKTDGGSPIMRGLKSVFNMFRSSQSPIPPESEGLVKQEVLSPAEVPTKPENSKMVMASTPISAHHKKETSPSKRNSPYKESIVFNDDLEKELQWKDETTILFSEERIPIHKLFFQQTQPTNAINTIKLTNEVVPHVELDSTVEYMDISYNDSMAKDRTLTDIKADGNKAESTFAGESDSEFVDCETTFTKNESQILDEATQVNQTQDMIKNISKNVSTSKLRPIILNTTQDILDATLSITPEDIYPEVLDITKELPQSLATKIRNMDIMKVTDNLNATKVIEQAVRIENEAAIHGHEQKIDQTFEITSQTINTESDKHNITETIDNITTEIEAGNHSIIKLTDECDVTKTIETYTLQAIDQNHEATQSIENQSKMVSNLNDTKTLEIDAHIDSKSEGQANIKNLDAKPATENQSKMVDSLNVTKTLEIDAQIDSKTEERRKTQNLDAKPAIENQSKMVDNLNVTKTLEIDAQIDSKSEERGKIQNLDAKPAIENQSKMVDNLNVTKTLDIDAHIDSKSQERDSTQNLDATHTIENSLKIIEGQEISLIPSSLDVTHTFQNNNVESLIKQTHQPNTEQSIKNILTEDNETLAQAKNQHVEPTAIENNATGEKLEDQPIANLSGNINITNEYLPIEYKTGEQSNIPVLENNNLITERDFAIEQVNITKDIDTANDNNLGTGGETCKPFEGEVNETVPKHDESLSLNDKPLELPTDIPLPDEDDIDKELEVRVENTSENVISCYLPPNFVDHIKTKTEDTDSKEVKLTTEKDVKAVLPEVLQSNITNIASKLSIELHQINEIKTEKLLKQNIPGTVNNDVIPEVNPAPDHLIIEDEKTPTDELDSSKIVVTQTEPTVNVILPYGKRESNPELDVPLPKDINESICEQKPLPDIINQITLSSQEDIEQVIKGDFIEQQSPHEPAAIGDNIENMNVVIPPFTQMLPTAVENVPQESGDLKVCEVPKCCEIPIANEIVEDIPIVPTNDAAMTINDVIANMSIDEKVDRSGNVKDDLQLDITTSTSDSSQTNNVLLEPETTGIDSSAVSVCGKVIEDTKVLDEEVVASENNSPFVCITAEPETRVDAVNLDDQLATKTRIVCTPPASPPIASKGYNFNFDEYDDPFDTKTKTPMSPTLDTPNKCGEPKESEQYVKKAFMGRKEVNNRRKSQPERKRPLAPKNKFNSTLNNAKEQSAEKIGDGSSEIGNVLKESFDKEDKEVQDIIKTANKNIEQKLREALKVNDDIEGVGEKVEATPIVEKSSVEAMMEAKNSSSSEQSTYFSVGTSSSESIKSKNVFNLPEIDDMNFNPFATKSKMRQTPPLNQDIENPFATRSKMVSSPDIPLNDANVTINIEAKSTSDDKMETEIMEKDSSTNISNTTTSSKATNEGDTTMREVNTEDEDTAEGPFLELEDLHNEVKLSEFDSVNDMMQFNEVPPQVKEENQDDELFIDAEAFEFLLNQNKSNTVVDSGKESLFLKFDPLFAKRTSSDGVLAALTQLQKRQSTPTKITKLPPRERVSPIAGPSNMNITHDVDINTSEDLNDDLNVTVSKPMMVVPPAVNPVTPRNKSVTPTRPNRRSVTFTSPAMAVIDRLLSLSANNSPIYDNTFTRVSREQNEADLALTQLRELLAEKEIHVYNLKAESKELKDRLTTMESQVRTLETESQTRLKKINDLNETLVEKSKINKSMALVVEEYERTIASLIAEIEQDKKKHAEERLKLINERDEQTAHLASMEVSFSDLHSKYEKSKQVIFSCKSNEDVYKKSLKEFEENVTKMQNNFDLLKQHATSKLNHANQELEKMNKAHEHEVLKLNAMIKRKELHITSLEETLTQKTKANEELTAICDELINKVG